MTKKETDKISHSPNLEKDLSNNLEATNKLIQRIDKLISLFEDAAKHVEEVETTEAKVNALADKLGLLLEQNKSIAQGLLLLEKYVRGKTSFAPTPRPSMEATYK